jgi:hypothetical protein
MLFLNGLKYFTQGDDSVISCSLPFPGAMTVIAKHSYNEGYWNVPIDGVSTAETELINFLGKYILFVTYYTDDSTALNFQSTLLECDLMRKVTKLALVDSCISTTKYFSCSTALFGWNYL